MMCITMHEVLYHSPSILTTFIGLNHYWTPLTIPRAYYFPAFISVGSLLPPPPVSLTSYMEESYLQLFISNLLNSINLKAFQQLSYDF